MNLSITFDVDIYRNLHPDLSHFDNCAHYEECGKKELRICSNVFSIGSLVSVINNNQKTLEIGPFDCPVLHLLTFRTPIFI